MVVLALQSTALSAQNTLSPLVVHEWGTFTSLQNEKGEAVGGINTDDEPVPKFVHRLANFLLLGPTEVPAFFFQGAPRCHPDVTMRLETPVLYFHPSEQKILQDVDVTATFRGGWLSEFYPEAEADAPGVQTNSMAFGPLRSNTESTLAWKNLALGGDWPGPTTDDHVWTSPRAVRAATVRTPGGEAEKFLFYRGVAHIDAPLSISQDAGTDALVLRSQFSIDGDQALKIKSLWLVDIRPDGEVAFRSIPAVTLPRPGKFVAKTSSHFRPGDYSADNRRKLKGALHEALMAEGLFDDEAQALLNTWELSYFKSAGLRLFFMVPRAWTDFYLPLNISTPADITRVMVGRIELVTPSQRDLLRQLAGFSAEKIKEDAKSLYQSFTQRMGTNGRELGDVDAGRESLATFGAAVPKSYQLYLDLGRFRNALILEEASRKPTPGLAAFIERYRLEGYQPK